MGLCSVVRYTIGQAAAVRHLSQKHADMHIHEKACQHPSHPQSPSWQPSDAQKEALRLLVQMMVGTTCGLLCLVA